MWSNFGCPLGRVPTVGGATMAKSEPLMQPLPNSINGIKYCLDALHCVTCSWSTLQAFTARKKTTNLYPQSKPGDDRAVPACVGPARAGPPLPRAGARLHQGAHDAGRRRGQGSRYGAPQGALVRGQGSRSGAPQRALTWALVRGRPLSFILWLLSRLQSTSSSPLRHLFNFIVFILLSA